MGKRVIVADSDSVVQQVASYFLKLEGYDVEAVGDGVSVMKAIEKCPPDVIVMTPDLPGINGVEVSRFVRENRQYKGIPIIFIAESEESLLNNFPDLSQTFGIIYKPIDPTKLVNTIKEYLTTGAAHEKDMTESLKSIEELLGWDVADKKMVKNTEEVLHGKSMERSFDVTEMLAGNINVSEDDAEHVEADLKHRVTDEMIENMVMKIAVDIVERVTRELVPDIAEREIIKEIERLKGIE